MQHSISGTIIAIEFKLQDDVFKIGKSRGVCLCALSHAVIEFNAALSNSPQGRSFRNLIISFMIGKAQFVCSFGFTPEMKEIFIELV